MSTLRLLFSAQENNNLMLLKIIHLTFSNNHLLSDRHDITEILLKVAKFAIQQDICYRNEHLIFCKFISILNVANFVPTLISGERYKLFGVYFGVPCNPLFKICFTKAIVAMIYKTVCLFMCNN